MLNQYCSEEDGSIELGEKAGSCDFGVDFETDYAYEQQLQQQQQHSNNSKFSYFLEPISVALSKTRFRIHSYQLTQASSLLLSDEGQQQSKFILLGTRDGELSRRTVSP